MKPRMIWPVLNVDPCCVAKVSTIASCDTIMMLMPVSRMGRRPQRSTTVIEARTATSAMPCTRVDMRIDSVLVSIPMAWKILGP